jgi:hypothetical protein
MAALDIPGVGERVGRYIRTLDVGFTGEGADVTVTSAGTYALFNINEPNVMVHKIDKQVIIPFTATGSLTIGDTDDVDGYWLDTLFLSSVCDAVFANQSTVHAYYGGKLYTSTNIIEMVKTGDLAAGKARLRIEYSRGVDTDIKPATSS